MSSVFTKQGQSRLMGNPAVYFSKPTNEEIIRNYSLASMDIPSARVSSIYPNSFKSNNFLQNSSFNQLINGSMSRSLPPGIVQNIIDEELGRLAMGSTQKGETTTQKGANFENPYYDNSSIHNKLPKSLNGLAKKEAVGDSLDQIITDKQSNFESKSDQNRDSGKNVQRRLQEQANLKDKDRELEAFEGQEHQMGKEKQFKGRELSPIDFSENLNDLRVTRNVRIQKNRFRTFESELSIERKLEQIKKLEEVVASQKREPGLRIGNSPEENELIRLKRQVELDQVWEKQIQKHSREKYKEMIRKREEERMTEAKVKKDLEELKQRFEQEKKRERSIDSDKHKRRNSKGKFPGGISQNNSRIQSSIRGRTTTQENEEGNRKQKQQVSFSPEESSGSESPTKKSKIGGASGHSPSGKGETKEGGDFEKVGINEGEEIKKQRKVAREGAKSNEVGLYRDEKAFGATERSFVSKSVSLNQGSERKYQEMHGRSLEQHRKQERERDSLSELRETTERNTRITRARIFNQAEDYKTIAPALRLSLDFYDKNPLTKGLRGLDSGGPYHQKHSSEPLYSVPEVLPSIYEQPIQFISVSPPNPIQNANSLDPDSLFRNDLDKTLENVLEDIDSISRIKA